MISLSVYATTDNKQPSNSLSMVIFEVARHIGNRDSIKPGIVRAHQLPTDCKNKTLTFN